MRVTYSSTIDKILIIPRLIASVAIFGIIFGGIISILDFFDIPKKLEFGEFFNVSLFIILLLVSGIVSNFIYSKTAGNFMYNLSAFLYIRFNLKTKISWKDSCSVAFLFNPNFTGKWYPLNEVLMIDPEKRVSYIKQFANKIL